MLRWWGMVRHGNGGSKNIASVPFVRSNSRCPIQIPQLQDGDLGQQEWLTHWCHDNQASCSDSVLERPMLTLQPTHRIPQGSAAASVARGPEDTASSPSPHP